MSDKPTLTTESGAPVPDNQNSQTAGAGGPDAACRTSAHREARALRFRERIPERVVHAVGYRGVRHTRGHAPTCRRGRG